MRVGLRMLKSSTVAWMRSEVGRGALSRAQLARGLCEQDDWRNPRGKPCLASARKALPRLAADLGLPLPKPTRRTGGCRRRSPETARASCPALQLQCSLDALGPVRVSPAETHEQKRHLLHLLDAEHPLQRGLAPGCRLLCQRASRVRLLLMDCDGVLTDGKVFFLPAPDGTIAETKGFDCHDGIALKWAREAGIETGIITGRGGLAVQERALSSDMRFLVEGRTDKLDSFRRILGEAEVSPEQVAFIGDDLTDLPLLGRVGLAIGPANARPEVREVVHWLTPSPGGHGAVREAIELLLEAQDLWEGILEHYNGGCSGDGRTEAKGS